MKRTTTYFNFFINRIVNLGIAYACTRIPIKDVQLYLHDDPNTPTPAWVAAIIVALYLIKLFGYINIGCIGFDILAGICQLLHGDDEPEIMAGVLTIRTFFVNAPDDPNDPFYNYSYYVDIDTKRKANEIFKYVEAEQHRRNRTRRNR
jgi:hypothetical protein